MSDPSAVSPLPPLTKTEREAIQSEARHLIAMSNEAVTLVASSYRNVLARYEATLQALEAGPYSARACRGHFHVECDGMDVMTHVDGTMDEAAAIAEAERKNAEWNLSKSKLEDDLQTAATRMAQLEAELASRSSFPAVPSDTDRLNAMAKLDEIATLPDNWDSYGADTPWPDAIATARRIVTLFQHAPAIVPLSDGGVQLEWYREGFELEIRVEPHGEVDPDISLDADRSHSSPSVPEKDNNG